jgi:hypothetical protein
LISLWLVMDEHGGHEDLRDSGRRSIIPYIHGRTRVVLLKPALVEPDFLSASQKWHMSEPFIAQARVVTMNPKARQVILRWLKSYTTARVLMAGVANDVLHSVPWCRPVGSYNDWSHVQEWSAGPTLHCRNAL